MSRTAQFGLFEADLEEGTLRKQGRLIRLQRQPFELLRILVEHPAQMVSRDQLRAQLWSADVVVDFDQSLNKSATKLRDALGDSAANPRFIETVPRRGYRFIAPVTVTDSARPAVGPNAAAVPATLTLAAEPDVDAIPRYAPAMLVPLGVLAGLVVALLSFTATSRRTAPPTGVAAPSSEVPSTAARDLYARGRIALLRRSEEGLRNGLDLFMRAITIAPGYDAAYVGVADAWSLLASYGMDEPRAAMLRARDYAGRALAINPSSAEAHASLGRTSMLADWDWQLSESHFEKAIALNANYATAHQWYAYLLSATGRHDEAERAAVRAATLDRMSPNAATGVGYVQYVSRKFDRSATSLRHVLEIDPDFAQARRNLCLVLSMQGKHAEAVSECQRVARLTNDATAALADLAWVLGRMGDRDGARGILARLEARRDTQYVADDSLAKALVGAGYREPAIDALAKAFEARVATVAGVAVDPAWDELRDAPGFQDLAGRLIARR